MLKKLYPSIEPFASQWLDMSDGHEVYVEQVGNPNGTPVIFLHGGPGSSCKDHHRCFFNPDKYHVILMDQRGAGRSKPLGRLKNNTTNHLLADMEHIRQTFGIDKWLLFGGSWGATLALLYAEKHVQQTLGLVLRGTFLARKVDANWFFKTGGVNKCYPTAWTRFNNHVPIDERENLLAAYHQRLNSDNPMVQQEAAREWDAWGGAVVLGDDFDASELGGDVSASAIAQARIETHYGMSRYFIEENQILNNTASIKGIPCTIIHGEKDDMCPITSAYQLAKQLGETKVICLKNSGHLSHGDEMVNALVDAADSMLNGEG